MKDSALDPTVAAGDDGIAWPASRRWQGSRPYQEDHYGILKFDIAGQQPALLMVLADGMGGAAGGATASRTVVEAFTGHFPHIVGTIDARFRQCLEAAAASLHEQVTADPQLNGMGSTVVAVLYDGQGISWLSVGDSPMWLFDGRRLLRLNEDHSMAPVLDRLAETGEMSAEDARYDRRRNMLRSVVTDAEAELVDCANRSGRLKPDEYLLIASDGLETLAEAEIAQLLDAAAGDAESAADALISAVRAESGAGQDNVTFLLLSGKIGSRDSGVATTDLKTDLLKTPDNRLPEVPLALESTARSGDSRLWSKGGAMGAAAVGVLLLALALWWLWEPPRPAVDPANEAPAIAKKKPSDDGIRKKPPKTVKKHAPAAPSDKKSDAKPGQSANSNSKANKRIKDDSDGGTKKASEPNAKPGEQKTVVPKKVEVVPKKRPSDDEANKDKLPASNSSGDQKSGEAKEQ